MPWSSFEVTLALCKSTRNILFYSLESGRAACRKRESQSCRVYFLYFSFSLLIFYCCLTLEIPWYSNTVFLGCCTIPFGAVVLFIITHFPTLWSLQMSPSSLQNFTLFPLGTWWYYSPKIYSAGTWGTKCKKSTAAHSWTWTMGMEKIPAFPHSEFEYPSSSVLNI